jgi:CBS domain-containing protein
MTRDVEIMEPGSLLKDVVITMLEKRIGSVVIARARRVVGIFTTIDALAALSLLLADVD